MCSATYLEINEEIYDKFEKSIEEIVEKFSVGNVSVGIVRKGKTEYIHGFTNRAGRTINTNEQTLFAIGSASKSFCALSVALLVQDGKLSFDDKIIEYLPNFSFYDNYLTQNATIRDCLAQKMGLGESAGNFLFFANENSQHEIVKKLQYLKPKYGFREKFAYQNLTFILIGELVEKVTGMPWIKFVQERILKPLDMVNTYVTYTAYQLENVAKPERLMEDGPEEIPHRNIENAAASGGIISCAEDMCKYLELQLGHRSDIISSKILHEMHKGEMVIPIEDFWEIIAYDNKSFEYGMGWFRSVYKDEIVIHHGGYIDGMSAHMALLPAHDLAIIVLTNQDQSLVPSVIWRRGVDLLLNKKGSDYEEKFLNTAKIMAKKHIPAYIPKKYNEEYKEYLGVYYSVLYDNMEIMEKNDKIVVTKGRYYTGFVVEKDGDKLLVQWRDPVLGISWLTFERENQEVVTVNLPAMGYFHK